MKFVNRVLLKRIILPVLCVLGLNLVSAGASPAYGFSVTEEREVGEKLLVLIRQKLNLLDDPDLVQYVRGLGREIIEVSGPHYFDYQFFMVRNRELNAFAAPSGLIFFHSGLVEAVDHENEFVSVMAHEVAHASSRHIAGRLEKSKKTSVGTLALMLAGIALGDGALAEALITGSMAANVSLGMKFSRVDEEEADRLAFKWMQESKRDPAAMVDMLREMRRIDLFRGGNLPPYLLTHPQPSVRMGYVQDLMLFNRGKEYRRIDEFPFQRFKKRVEALTRDTGLLISRYTGYIARQDTAPAEKTMAEYGLALAYAEEADFARAERYLKKVMGRYPDQVMLKVDLGVIYYDAGRYREAFMLLKEAVGEDYDNAYAAYYLAKTLQRTGKPQQAARIYEELLTLIPDYPKFYYELGRIRAEQGDQGAGYYYLGMSQWYEGDLKIARINLNKAIENLPADHKLTGRAKDMLAGIKKVEKK